MRVILQAEDASTHLILSVWPLEGLGQWDF